MTKLTEKTAVQLASNLREVIATSSKLLAHIEERETVPLWTAAEEVVFTKDPNARCQLTSKVVPPEHLVRVKWGQIRLVHPGVAAYFKSLGRGPRPGEKIPASALEPPRIPPHDLVIGANEVAKFTSLTRPALMKVAKEMGLTARLSVILKDRTDPALSGLTPAQVKTVLRDITPAGGWRHWPALRIAKALTSLWYERHGRRQSDGRLDPKAEPPVFRVPSAQEGLEP